jgi:saccharopine dehydrogenase (NAD+, L-lysine-forming)
MSKAIVLGACGGIGSVALRALAGGDYFDEIVAADVRIDGARTLVAELGNSNITAQAFDAASPESIKALVAGATVVVNCVGPFYRFGPVVLKAVIDAGVDYVDVCDDLDPTLVMLDMDEAAKAAGVSALIGMGNSPGLANVLARLCADQFLDETESVDIMHIHGGEPEEGPAVIKHRIHAMTNDVPVFVDGELRNVRMLEESGKAFIEETDFRDVGTYPVYPYPHPETITLPRYIKGLKRATNRGVVFPLSYFNRTMDMVRVGACVEEPLTVQGSPVSPIEFSVAHILRERAVFLAEAGVTGPAGCLKVVVSGLKGGERHTYVFQISSTSRGAGEGTGIPAALGAILMSRGAINSKGVFPPEAAVDPLQMIALAPEVTKAFGMGEGSPFSFEHIGPDGVAQQIDVGA